MIDAQTVASLAGVSLRYGKSHAVEGISLDIPATAWLD